MHPPALRHSPSRRARAPQPSEMRAPSLQRPVSTEFSEARGRGFYSQFFRCANPLPPWIPVFSTFVQSGGHIPPGPPRRSAQPPGRGPAMPAKPPRNAQAEYPQNAPSNPISPDAASPAFAGTLLPTERAGGQCLAQSLFSALPDCIGARAQRWTQRELNIDLRKTKIFIDLQRQRIKRDCLCNDLILGAKNMRIVLHKAAHAHQAMQRARRLIPVACAEFCQPQRQIAIRTQRMIENLHVPRATHRLDRVVALFRLGREHLLAVVLPVA